MVILKVRPKSTIWRAPTPEAVARAYFTTFCQPCDGGTLRGSLRGGEGSLHARKLHACFFHGWAGLLLVGLSWDFECPGQKIRHDHHRDWRQDAGAMDQRDSEQGSQPRRGGSAF